MPLVLNKKVAPDSTLGVWKIIENIHDLETVFPLLEAEDKYYTKLKNDKRRREWLIARILLTEITESRKLIKYTEHGKPFIANSSTNISITHSKNHVGVLISNKLTPGIDIEHIADRVVKVKHKFLSEKELTWCNNRQLMTLCWSAKEAVFKIFEKELDFHDIEIEEFDSNDTYFQAKTKKKNIHKSFKVFFDFIEEDVLTYTFQYM